MIHSMGPVSSVPAIASLLVALATAFLLVKQFGGPAENGRFASIDGLRGYLAFFVFLHHSSIWYFYLRSGKWELPPSNLYVHFGRSSVELFFMITGFLFFSKLISGREKRIDWGKLYISRFLRLVPLYLFSMMLLYLIIACLSNGIISEPIPKLMKETVSWLGFTILGMPDINGIEDTFTIDAGVTWSLPYEWFFYFSLPILALAVRVVPPIPYIALGAASIVGLAITISSGIWNPKILHLMSFLGGIAASFLVRVDSFRNIAVTKVGSFIALGSIGIAVAAFPSAYGAIPLFMLSVAFAFIACGNSMFGVLTGSVSRALGESAYSIYLLHGIILFVAFNFVIGVAESRSLSPIAHWLIVIGITPILIFICFVTFRLIERPAMQSTTVFTNWLRSHVTLCSKKRASGGDL